MDPRRIPVLVGASRRTDRSAKDQSKRADSDWLTPEFLAARAPSKALADVARAALRDANVQTPGITEGDCVKAVCAIRVNMEVMSQPTNKNGSRLAEYKSLASSVAYSAGFSKATLLVDTPVGGNTPQSLVNEFADRIAKGTFDKGLCVIIGGESLATFEAARSRGVPIPWGGAFEDPPATTFPSSNDTPVMEFLGNKTPGNSDVEMANGVATPRRIYPMLEQAFRVTQQGGGRDVNSHVKYMASVFEGFNSVASSPSERANAWFPDRRTASEIATPTSTNRWIGFPYTKTMNSVMDVDQWSAVVLTSLAEAQRLGIPESKYVFLHGTGEAVEPGYFVSVRPQLGKSFALETSIQQALSQAQVSPKEISFFDLYSCFPIAVELACAKLDIDPLTDPRPLTVTGGLPYAGGPGNSYTLGAIAAMMVVLRRNSGQFGLVNGNGWFLTKHACGVYSTRRPTRPFVRRDPKQIQAELDAVHVPLLRQVCKLPNGNGVIESYTVDHSRGRVGVVIGTITTEGADRGKRFLATSNDVKVLDALMERDLMGAPCSVVSPSPSGKGSTFSLLNLSEFDKWPRMNTEAQKPSML